MRKINGIQFRAAVESAAHKIAAHLGMSVTIFWSNQITTAAISDAGEMYLANVADDAMVDEALIWKYTAMYFHELLHRKYTTQWRGLTAYAPQYLTTLLNSIEDAWIETRAIHEGLIPNGLELLSRLLDGMCNEALQEVQNWQDPAQYTWVLAVYLRDHASIKMPMAAGLEPIFAKAKADMAQSTCTADNMVIAKWVYEQLKKAEQPRKPDQSTKPDTQSGQAAGKGDSKGDSKGGAQGKQGNAAGDQKGDKGGEGDSKAGQGGAQGKQEGTQKGAQGQQTAAPGGEQGEGQSAAPAASPVGERQQVGERTRAVEVEATATPIGDSAAGGSYSDTAFAVDAERHVRAISQRSIDINGAASARLRNEIRRLFDKSGREDWQINRAAGRLNAGQLATVQHGNVNVFKRRAEVSGIDSAVTVLLDVSGSMKKNRIDMAAVAVATLCDTLRRANVKVQVMSFNHSIAVLNDWNEPAQKVTDLMSRVSVVGSTNDYVALRMAHKSLSQRPEQRKVCFVISDGCGAREHTRAQVLSGARMGITTIGIGIADDVSDIYDNYVNLKDASDLANVSFKAIRGVV